jgi:hypothetical protein
MGAAFLLFLRCDDCLSSFDRRKGYSLASTTTFKPQNVLRLACIALAPIALGAGVGINPELGLAVTALILGALALVAPAGAWAMAALVAVITFRGLSTFGLLPSAAAYLDIPICWGALVAATFRSRGWTGAARKQMVWFGAFIASVIVAWLFHRSEPLRPVFYILLLGQPFAILGALLIDPPTPRLRQAITWTIGILVAIQIPLALAQAAKFGLGDAVQGSIYDPGSPGAHLMSAIIAIVALWMLFHRSMSGVRIPIALVLMMITVLADAKQVILALPVAFIVSRPPVKKMSSYVVQLGLFVSLVVGLLVFDPFGQAAPAYLSRAGSGNNAKLAVAQLVGGEIASDAPSLAFGLGPAQSVTRAAYMTTDFYLEADSPIRKAHFSPAKLASASDELATKAAGGPALHLQSSFNSGISSAIGVFGDLGLVGGFAYVGMVASLFLSLRRSRNALAYACACGWAMFGLLGIVFDWWEEPPFSVFLAVMTGLALTLPAPEDEEPSQELEPLYG